MIAEGWLALPHFLHSCISVAVTEVVKNNRKTTNAFLLVSHVYKTEK